MGAFAIDGLDMFNDAKDFVSKILKKKYSKLLGGAFKYLAVFMDLLGAIATVGALAESCGWGAWKEIPLVILLSALALIISISAFVVINPFVAPIAMALFALVLGIISSFASIQLNLLIAGISGDKINKCKQRRKIKLIKIK